MLLFVRCAVVAAQFVHVHVRTQAAVLHVRQIGDRLGAYTLEVHMSRLGLLLLPARMDERSGRVGVERSGEVAVGRCTVEAFEEASEEASEKAWAK